MSINNPVIENNYHHGDVENSCIEAAFKILIAKGFNNLNLRAVTKEVGISHNAPYRYFKNKEELLIALIIRIYKELQLELEQVIANSNGVMEEDYLNLAKVYVEYARNNYEKYRLISCFMIRDIGQYPELTKNVYETFSKVQTLLDNYITNENATSFDSIKFTAFCISTLHGYCTLLIEKKIEMLSPKVKDENKKDELLIYIVDELVRLTKIRNCKENQ